MTSLRTRWVGFARGAAWLSVFTFSGCGITFPGELDIGADDPGVIGASGRGGSGSGGGVAGRGAAGAAGVWSAGSGGPTPAGQGGFAGSWGGSAGFDGGRQDRDGDGFQAWNDCNDLDPNIHIRAEDVCCDGIDNDCDGGDGPQGGSCTCSPDGIRDYDGDGFSSAKGDCNDRDASYFPGNPWEVCCDGLDNDCDGRDAPQFSFCECTATDWDGDGFIAGPGGMFDCNDNDASVFPGAPELCDDGIDNNCNGHFDWLDGCVPSDADGDGYPRGSDCNDFDYTVHPGRTEVCNNRVDDNCDGVVDGRRCTTDVDRDGYPRGEDCDDDDPSVYPGAFEVCFDGRDGNCDGLSDFEDGACRGQRDDDGDGYTLDSDCDDANASIHPAMREICGDGVDNDCDGLVDPFPYCGDQALDWDRDGHPWSKDCNDGDSLVFPGSPYERCCDGLDSDCNGSDAPAGGTCGCMVEGDHDGDGFGVGFSEPGRADCNDQDASIYPGAPEVCGDRRDNNCNGLADAADPQCGGPF